MLEKTSGRHFYPKQLNLNVTGGKSHANGPTVAFSQHAMGPKPDADIKQIIKTMF